MEFLPMEDNSEFQVLIKAPVGTNIESMRKKVAPLLKQIEQDELVEYTVLSIGYNSANEIHKAKIYAKLKPVKLRVGISQEQIVQKYRDKFNSIKKYGRYCRRFTSI